jgi:hypothetical protein
VGDQGQYEVKGLWFVSASDWLTRVHGVEARQRVARHMGEHGGLLQDAIASEWYPERALQDALAGLRAELAEGDPDRFVEVVRNMVGSGIGRFFRLMLQLGSASFVLRKVPVLWTRVQRGPGHVSVDSQPDRAVIRYRNFPFFSDPNYPLMTGASLQAMVQASTGRIPTARVVGSGDDWLDIEINHGG